MNASTTRLMFAIVVVLLGGLCCYFYLLQELNQAGEPYFVLPRYVSPGFHLATLVGGLGMIVIGLFLLFTMKKQSGCSHDHGEEDHDHEHDHGDMNPIAALCIIAIPILFSVGYSQHSFNEVELSRRSELDMNPETFERMAIPLFTLDELDEYKSKNANGAYQMEVMELFLTAGDPDVAKVMDGVKVEVEGAVRSQPGDEENPKVKRLYRMVMQCCAADMQAIPIKIYLSEELSESFAFPNHTWLKLEGKLAYEIDKHGVKQTVLNVVKAEEANPPDTEILLSGRRR